MQSKNRSLEKDSFAVICAHMALAACNNWLSKEGQLDSVIGLRFKTGNASEAN